MFLGGLWHGASWTFVAWGLLHGFYLSAEHLLKQWLGGHRWAATPASRFVWGLLTFLLVCLGWVFFRARDFSSAWLLFGSLFGVHQEGVELLSTREILQVAGVLLGLLGAHIYLREKRLEHAMEGFPRAYVVSIWVAMLAGLILMQGGANAFIYFQF